VRRRKKENNPQSEPNYKCREREKKRENVRKNLM
jgi:hypothetical protein